MAEQVWWKSLSLEERFWLRVEKTDTCWLWTGLPDKDGYGVLRAHELTEENTYRDPKLGTRACRKCRADHRRRSTARLRERKATMNKTTTNEEKA